jgi:hypothetical protein
MDDLMIPRLPDDDDSDGQEQALDDDRPLFDEQDQDNSPEAGSAPPALRAGTPALTRSSKIQPIRRPGIDPAGFFMSDQAEPASQG